MSTFDSTKIGLPEMINQIIEGKVQLPDFQRGWVWDDSHVRSLLISIARSFPIGAVMLLETGGEVRFQVRPVENLIFSESLPEPERLILDGQQRLTSLTQVLALKTPVKTFNEQGKPIERYYYINIQAALDNQLDEAFIAVEKDRMRKTNFGRDVELDLSDVEKECQAFYFPCNQILNSDEWEKSLMLYNRDKFFTYMEFREKVLRPFRDYDVPLITLKKATSKEAVCLVFEKVNTGGVPLSVFELVTASFAADGFNLRDDWYGSKLRQVEGRVTRIKQNDILKTIEPTDFLQAITLLCTYEKRQADLQEGLSGKNVSAVNAKRASVLSLNLQDYQKWADIVEKGFQLAAAFMRKQCFFSNRDLPYRTQLIPLAAVLSLLQEKWLEPQIYNKLNQWFWCGVLGELYGGAVETRIANDLDDLLAWVNDGGGLPRTVIDASFDVNRLDTLRSRLSAAYKGINVLLLRDGAKDFFWKATIQELDREEVQLDIHHIFPKIWCEQQGIHADIYNSIINKTPISYKANRMIGGKAPSNYLCAIQEHKNVKLNDSEMNDILISHCIPYEQLRADDFLGFMNKRKENILNRIQEVMGKSLLKE